MSDTIVSCVGLVKNYGKVESLRGVDLTLERGRIVGLLGPNGSGKTTLLKLLCGLLQPTAGTISVGGMAVGPEAKAIISYLPDRMFFSNWMRVQDLLSTFRDFYRDFDEAKARQMLESLHVDPKAKIKTLSKGTKEKVQLVLAMARQAQLYLLDEPIAGVDPAARDYILQTILANYNPEGTVLISTHLISDVEQVLDEVVFLKEGRIVLQDSVDNIRTREGCSVDDLFRTVFRVQEGGVS